MKESYFKQVYIILLTTTLFFVVLKEFLPKRIFDRATPLSNNIVVDSLMLEAISQSKKDSISIKEIDSTLSDNPILINSNHNQHLTVFFEKLKQLETSGQGKIRIAYFGDSMTDGDYIVQDLRELFQDEFGGRGVGFVSITSESAASRGSVKHTYSKNWKTQSCVNVKKPQKPFGVSGQVSFARNVGEATWVEYKASYQKNLTQLYTPVLYYGASNNKEAYVELYYNGDTTKVVKSLQPTQRLNALQLADQNVKSIKLKFVKADSIAFYGINSDAQQGVMIDNFSSRGNSGLPLSMFNVPLMQDFDRELGSYDLVVLHFGTNVLNYGTLDYSWYEKGMEKVIQQVRNCFPQASVLIISTADRSKKYDTEMKTDAAVVPLSNAQHNFATKTNSGFINLYQLMGGEGSMIQWVESEPALASKDYTHFNLRGSRKVAHLIYDELKKGYSLFKNRNSEQTQAQTADRAE